MEQLQTTYQQAQGIIAVVLVVLAVLMAWWAVSKVRGAIGTLVQMPIGKKLWLATLVLLALWFTGMAGVDPMHAYLVRNGAPSTFPQLVGTAIAFKRAGLYWLDTNTWVPLALGA